MHKLSQIKRSVLRLAMMALCVVTLTGCNGLIYDDEGDCDPYFKVRFVYETNLKFTDAFAAEVKEVTLYVIDSESGKIVRQLHDSGEALMQPGYLMDVDVEPGNYDLIAWCGEGHTTSFTVAEGTLRHHLQCTLTDRQAPEGNIGTEGSHVRNRLGNLYHGYERNVEFEDKQGVHVKTVHLIKDTNDLHIVLQHLSGEDIDHNDFTFTVTGSNGTMDHDNSLLDDEQLTYFAHTKLSGTAGVTVPDYTDQSNPARATVTQVSAAVAHMSLSRLTEDSDTKVEIYNNEGEKIVSVPLVDYALLVRDQYKRPDGTPLTPQEYLDHQDDYSMVFFLDKNNRWIKTQIYINSWRVIMQENEL